MRRPGKIIPFPLRGGAPPRREEPEPVPLVEVYRCDLAEATVVKALLSSEGIPVLLRSHLAHSVHPFTVGDQGEVIVFVPEIAAVRSRRLLARVVPRRRQMGS